eukprot:343027_1
MGNKQGKASAKTKGLSSLQLMRYHAQCSKPLPTAKDIHLVHGYIRQTEDVLDSFFILPLIIYQWIFRYFESKNTLYWTSPQHIYSVSIQKDVRKERVNPLIKMNQCYCPAVCYGSDIHFAIDIDD